MTTATDRTSHTYLVFNLGSEEYGLPILRVREIIGLLPTTPMPGSRRHLRGVVNLRGRVVPVLCMRSRFNLQPAEPHPHNVIIVVEGEDQLPIGLLVDRVKEVASVPSGDAEPPPSYGLTIDMRYIAAIAKGQGRLRILLDIDRVLAEE